MTMTRFAAGLVLVAAVASSATAQSPATSNAPPAAAPAAPATITPAMRAAIKELLDATQTRENLGRTFQAMTSQLPAQLAGAINAKIEQSAITPEQKQKVRESMNAPFEVAVKDANAVVTDPKLIDQAYDRLFPIYAAHFTVDEIKQLTAFYKSPIGTKTKNEMPKVLAESMQGGISIFQPKLNAIVERTVKAQVDAVAAVKK